MCVHPQWSIHTLLFPDVYVKYTIKINHTAFACESAAAPLTVLLYCSVCRCNGKDACWSVSRNQREHVRHEKEKKCLCIFYMLLRELPKTKTEQAFRCVVGGCKILPIKVPGLVHRLTDLLLLPLYWGLLANASIFNSFLKKAKKAASIVGCLLEICV